jgi:hypothetical protein
LIGEWVVYAEFGCSARSVKNLVECTASVSTTASPI